MKAFRKGMILLLCLVLLSYLSIPAFAAGRIEPEKNVSLTIHFAYEGTDIPGAAFRIFRVAEVDAGAHFTLTDRFSEYPIRVENQTAAGWKSLAQALKGYVTADQLTPDASGVTNARGTMSFGNLKTGLYFVMGDKLSHDGYVYTIEPTLVALPNLVDEEWVYDVNILPKSTRQKDPSPVTEIKVMKAWEDKKAEKKRPEEITVYLLADEEIYDTVRLNQENNWRYTWENLPTVDGNGLPIDWSVSEKPVKNYDVRIERDGNVFVIVNRYDGPKTPNTPLPQTGQLWWPVPVLAFLGLCSIAAGALISRKKNQE